MLSATGRVGEIPRPQDIIIREHPEVDTESYRAQMPSPLPIRVAVQVSESLGAREEGRQAEARHSLPSGRRAAPRVAHRLRLYDMEQERQRHDEVEGRLLQAGGSSPV